MTPTTTKCQPTRLFAGDGENVDPEDQEFPDLLQVEENVEAQAETRPNILQQIQNTLEGTGLYRISYNKGGGGLEKEPSKSEISLNCKGYIPMY